MAAPIRDLRHCYPSYWFIPLGALMGLSCADVLWTIMDYTYFVICLYLWQYLLGHRFMAIWSLMPSDTVRTLYRIRYDPHW